jgi:phenylalanyl-tRNA synthetase beta subunit
MILSISEVGGFGKEVLPKEEQKDIVVLPEGTDLESDPAKELTLDGYVIDLSILPDRQYATNMQSLAYELAAYLDLELNELPESRANLSEELHATAELGEKATGLAVSKITLKEGGSTPQ